MRCFNDITYHIYFVITQLHLGALNTKFVKKRLINDTIKNNALFDGILMCYDSSLNSNFF